MGTNLGGSAPLAVTVESVFRGGRRRADDVVPDPGQQGAKDEHEAARDNNTQRETVRDEPGKLKNADSGKDDRHGGDGERAPGWRYPGPGFYDWRSRPQSATAKRRELLKTKIKALFEANNAEYGYRRIRAELVHGGEQASGELIRRMMRELDGPGYVSATHWPNRLSGLRGQPSGHLVGIHRLPAGRAGAKKSMSSWLTRSASS